MRLFFRLLVIAVLLGLLLNNIIENPIFKNPIEEINYARKTDNFYLAEKLYFQELQKNKQNIDLNYGYVSNHFSIPEITRIGKTTHYRNDDTIFNYYKELIKSKNVIYNDLGHYCLGLFYLYKDDYSEAEANFKEVKNTNLKYLNNSFGNTFKKTDTNRAIAYYEKEIILRGNLDGAVDNLSDIFLMTRNIKGFENLMNDYQIKKYISITKQRQYFYIKSDIKAYIFTLWLSFKSSIDRYGFIGALIIAFIWLFYLRYIDVFEKEKWYFIGSLFVISSMFTYFSYFLYDYLNITLNFDLNGDWLNDLLYCIFGIGLIEETIKLIPFVLFLIFTRTINEPIDYVIYACVSAIGFSFTENILYFQNDSYNIMHGRALSSVVGHMCESSIIAYGFILSKYKTKSPLYINIPVFLLLAAVVHGLYDFWLLNDDVSDFNIISLVVLVSSVFIWNSIKNNALNNSPFFDKSKRLESDRISQYLLIALSIVFLFEYIVICFNYGPSAGNRLFLKSIFTGSFLMFFITGRLARFELKAGVWKSIKIWDTEKEK